MSMARPNVTRCFKLESVLALVFAHAMYLVCVYLSPETAEGLSKLQMLGENLPEIGSRMVKVAALK